METVRRRGTVVALRRSENQAARLVDCARRVHRALGPGLEQPIYARALALELQAEKLEYRRECTVEVRFRGSNVGRVLLDFLVEGVAVALLPGPAAQPEERTRLAAAAIAAGVRTAVALAFGDRELRAVPVEVRR